MSLAPGERRALDRIEESLRRSDPRLTAQLATFTALTSRDRVPRWKCLSPWRLRIRAFCPVMIAMMAAGLIGASLLLFHPSGPAGPAGPPPAACRSVSGCPPAGQSSRYASPAGAHIRGVAGG